MGILFCHCSTGISNSLPLIFVINITSLCKILHQVTSNTSPPALPVIDRNHVLTRTLSSCTVQDHLLTVLVQKMQSNNKTIFSRIKHVGRSNIDEGNFLQKEEWRKTFPFWSPIYDALYLEQVIRQKIEIRQNLFYNLKINKIFKGVKIGKSNIFCKEGGQSHVEYSVKTINVLRINPFCKWIRRTKWAQKVWRERFVKILQLTQLQCCGKFGWEFDW